MSVRNDRDWLAGLLAGVTLIEGADAAAPLVLPRVPRRQAPGVRTDLAPLVRRLPGLGTPVAARWVWARLGGDRVPGPATYALDAVVTLTPADADRLRALARGPAASAAATLPGELGTPPEDLRGSDALDAALAHGTWRARAAVAASGPVVVVRALGRD